MSLLTQKLNRLEIHLQSLIEGNLSRLFPQHRIYQQLGQPLISALLAALYSDTSNQWRAPHLFSIHAHPQLAEQYQQHPDLLNMLVEMFQQSAELEGIEFSGIPEIDIISDAELERDELFVQTHGAPERLGDTAMLSPTIAPQPSVPENAFLIITGDTIHPLTRLVTNLGRLKDNHIVLNDPRVSRTHAQIRASSGRFIIFDLGSTGGTYVNNQRIHQCVLHSGDVISLAGIQLVFGQEGAETSKTQEYQPDSGVNPSNTQSDLNDKSGELS